MDHHNAGLKYNFEDSKMFDGVGFDFFGIGGSNIIKFLVFILFFMVLLVD